MKYFKVYYSSSSSLKIAPKGPSLTFLPSPRLKLSGPVTCTNQENAMEGTPRQTSHIFKTSGSFCFYLLGTLVFVNPKPNKAGSLATLLERL